MFKLLVWDWSRQSKPELGIKLFGHVLYFRYRPTAHRSYMRNNPGHEYPSMFILDWK
jgi:hypothetical protein